MYREKYAQRRAIQLFAQGKDRTEILNMLAEEGASSDQLETLADKYQNMHLLLTREDAKRQLKVAGMLKTIGAVFLICGVLLTLLSQFYFADGSYLVYYSLIGFGIGLLIKGSLDKKAATQQLT
ncbi:hypothetical protein [Hymenobacter weizhouensis]|uniref:hypothetical protein n=1 Tax=Hymenobacter sp. YIM 151500-1 TaxID=2987689 RepID=UPI002225EF45|nr:hypothetical protein [Hymenobacter sp. YIM 151500-1]UYZ63923.1 hypothetical protein OIS53_03550 [Hymenobacter sp. YIM 151500-1]